MVQGRSREAPVIWTTAWRDSPKDPGVGINVRGMWGKRFRLIFGYGLLSGMMSGLGHCRCSGGPTGMLRAPAQVN